MKLLICLTISVLGTNCWALQYSKCQNNSITLQFFTNRDPGTISLGVNTIVTLKQNNGGVPLPIMAKESITGNRTSYSSSQDFNLTVSRSMGKFSNFEGIAVVEGRTFHLICN